MAQFRWVRTGIDYVDDTNSVGFLLTRGTLRAALVVDSPLTFDWNWDAASLTKATGTGFDPIDISETATGPWHDSTNQCVYHKEPGLSWTNGTAGPVTVTGLEIYLDDVEDTLIGVVVFDDEEVLNIGDAIEVDVFIGIGTCNPESIVTIMEE
jgi:hypothetical protein